MRWDRLFDELEAQASDLELEERDALVADLRDGDWAETSWRDLLGGQVVLEVKGVGRVDGVVALVNDRLVQLGGHGFDHVVSASAVMAVHRTERRAVPPSAVGSALGWGHVFRAIRAQAEDVRIRLIDGTAHEGTVDVVGRDFVRVRTGGGRDQVLTFAGLAMVSGRT